MWTTKVPEYLQALFSINEGTMDEHRSSAVSCRILRYHAYSIEACQKRRAAPKDGYKLLSGHRSPDAVDKETRHARGHSNWASGHTAGNDGASRAARNRCCYCRLDACRR